jgi:LysM repeat protein
VVYTVRPGDTLSGLAEERGTSVAHLQKLNGLAAADVLFAGQDLKLPAARAAAAAPKKQPRAAPRQAPAAAPKKKQQQRQGQGQRPPQEQQGRRAPAAAAGPPARPASQVQELSREDVEALVRQTSAGLRSARRGTAQDTLLIVYGPGCRGSAQLEAPAEALARGLQRDRSVRVARFQGDGKADRAWLAKELKLGQLPGVYAFPRSGGMAGARRQPTHYAGKSAELDTPGLLAFLNECCRQGCADGKPALVLPRPAAPAPVPPGRRALSAAGRLGAGASGFSLRPPAPAALGSAGGWQLASAAFALGLLFRGLLAAGVRLLSGAFEPLKALKFAEQGRLDPRALDYRRIDVARVDAELSATRHRLRVLLWARWAYTLLRVRDALLFRAAAPRGPQEPPRDGPGAPPRPRRPR